MGSARKSSVTQTAYLDELNLQIHRLLLRQPRGQRVGRVPHSPLYRQFRHALRLIHHKALVGGVQVDI